MRTTKFLVIALLGLMSSCGKRMTSSHSDYVYICTSPKAEVYHSDPDCKGLSRCSYDVDMIDREKAAKFRRPCKICY